jgi:hypothetical protein
MLNRFQLVNWEDIPEEQKQEAKCTVSYREWLKTHKFIVFPDNDAWYGQDFGYHQGIPSGVKFKVETFMSQKNSHRMKLTSYGYGIVGGEDGKSYGNGALYVKWEDIKDIIDG